MSKVIIIGAGLAGSLLAIYLAKRGIETEVYEARGDMRQEEMSAGRSINLALSDRGIAALREVGMDEYMLSEAVPMLGRMIHSVEGETRNFCRIRARRRIYQLGFARRFEHRSDQRSRKIRRSQILF